MNDKPKIIRGCNFRYAATKEGEIWSFIAERSYIFKRRPKQIRHKPNDAGYCKIFLKRQGEGSAKNMTYVHRIIAQTFIPNPLNLPEVNHKDKNRANNHVENLEWCTHQYNIQHSYADGLRVFNMPKGVDHWNYGKSHSKATIEKMSDAKKGINHPKFKGWYIVNGKKYATPGEASKATGMHPKNIWRKCTGREKTKNFSFKPVI